MKGVGMHVKIKGPDELTIMAKDYEVRAWCQSSLHIYRAPSLLPSAPPLRSTRMVPRFGTGAFCPFPLHHIISHTYFEYISGFVSLCFI